MAPTIMQLYKVTASQTDKDSSDTTEFYIVATDIEEARKKGRRRAKEAMGEFNDFKVSEVLSKSGKGDDPKQTTVPGT